MILFKLWLVKDIHFEIMCYIAPEDCNHRRSAVNTVIDVVMELKDKFNGVALLADMTSGRNPGL